MVVFQLDQEDRLEAVVMVVDQEAEEDLKEADRRGHQEDLRAVGHQDQEEEPLVVDRPDHPDRLDRLEGPQSEARLGKVRVRRH